MEIIIEEINRGEKLLSRHKFFTHQIKIGRGYHNDIILADPHVCPEHLTINFIDDHWLVTDTSNINGCFLNDGKQSADQHIVRSGDIIRFGKSQIKLVLPDHHVEQAIPFSPFDDLIDLMRNPLILAFNILLFASVAGMMFYLNQARDVNVTQFIVRSVGVTLMFATWPILISLISHFNKHEARVLSQIAVSFALFNLMWFSDVFESIVTFNLSSNWHIAWLLTLLPIILTFCLIWLNCSIGFQMSECRRVIIALSITTLLFGGNYILQSSKKPEFSTLPNYDATIMTPFFKWSSSSTVDQFIKDSNKLFTETEKAARKKKN